MAESPQRRQLERFEQDDSPKKDTKPGKKRDATALQDASGVGPKGCTASWLQANADFIAEADRQIGITLADRKHFCEHTTPETHKICDDIFNNVMKLGPEGSENNSVLLLGEAASGKTHIVERCLKEFLQAEPSTVVLRARGSAYGTDVECLRHLATQMTDRLESIPHSNASFKAGMDWIKNVFKGSFKKARAMVMVLDQFEYFCSRARQTLLYNLFDIAQEAGVHLSVIGMSEKMDVMDSLEKRIRSRFSLRHMHTFLPTTFDGLLQVLLARLRLSPDSGLKTPFVDQFNRHLESALIAKRAEWKKHLDFRSPCWFLARCLPIASLLSETCSAEPAAKKPANLAHLPSCTNHEATMLILDSLTETDHIVLIGLYRLRARGLPRTLCTVLHEIHLFHQSPGHALLHSFNKDLYAAAFDRLLRLKLIVLDKTGATDTAKRHLPCAMDLGVESLYGTLVREFWTLEPAPWRNPLRSLPQAIQQWAARQRAMA